MYTATILKVGENHAEERINKARRNLHMENEDIICVAQNGYINRFDTLRGVNGFLNKNFETIELAMDALIEKLNAPEENE